jgi:PAS domain S-box-containing protein
MPIDLPLEEQIYKLYYDGYIHTCNDAFAKMYGYKKAEDIEGMDQKTLHGSDNDPKNIEILRNFIQSGYRIINDVTIETDVDGHALHILNNVVGIIEDGMLLRTWGSQKDITEQVMVQQKVEESAKRYRLLFETNPVPLVIFDANTLRFHDVNMAMVKLLGYSKKDISKLTIQDLRPEISELNQQDLKELVEKEINKTIELEIKSFSGKTIPCEVKFDRIEYMGVESILAAINDLTAIRRAEVLVIQSLIEGADNERNRVAKEIHDSLGQSLTAASLNLNSIKKEIPRMGSKAAEKFENGLKFLKTSMEESRNIAHNLMPKAIEDFGIVLTLNSLFNQLMKSTGLKINFYENLGQDLRPDINIELNLYRITQEAINNVMKHSEATEVFVQLMLHSNEIIYTFEDNGKGFDKHINNTGKKGIGLKSIYNRAVAMMGHCDIDSAPGEGTTITIIIPI